MLEGLGGGSNGQHLKDWSLGIRLCERVEDEEGRRLILSKEFWRSLKKWPKNLGWDGLVRVMKTLDSFILL